MAKDANGVNHNIEFLDYMLRDWTRNMWEDLNKDKYPDEKYPGDKLGYAFANAAYPDNNRGLSKKQSLSEQAFTLYVYGAVYSVGLVSEKAVDALTDNKLANAWRKSVQRNNFQQSYNFFEDTLKAYVEKNGADAAIAKFPKLNVSDPEEVAQALEYIGYKPKIYDTVYVAELIRRSNKPADPAAAAPAAPKAA